MSNDLKESLEEKEKTLLEMEKALNEREKLILEKEQDLIKEKEIERIIEESKIEYSKLKAENNSNRTITTILVCLILIFLALIGRTAFKTKSTVESYSNNAKISIEFNDTDNGYRITDYQNISN